MSGGTDTTDLARLLADATLGPWVALPCHVRDNWNASKPLFPEGLWRILPEWNVERVPLAEVDRADDHHLPTRLSAEADAALIVAAVNALPDLLATITRLQADLDAAVARAEKAEALEWLDENPNLELHHYSPMYGDDDDDAIEWRVTRVNGSINDREWTVVGRGETPAAAIASARTALDDGGVRS